MQPKTLSALTSAKKRSIIRQDFEGPVFRGRKGKSYTCPHCGNLLAESVPLMAVFDVVIECGRCKKYSAFPPLPKNIRTIGWVFFPIGIFRITATIDIKTARAFGVDKNGKGPPGEHTKPGPLLS